MSDFSSSSKSHRSIDFNSFISNKRFRTDNVVNHLSTNISDTLSETNISINCFLIDESAVLVVMKHPSTIFFNGLLNVKSLVGKVEIHGFFLRPEGRTVTVCSTGNASAYGISTCEDSVVPPEIDHDLINELPFTQGKLEELINSVRPNGVLIKFSVTPSMGDNYSLLRPNFINILSAVPRRKDLFEKSERVLNCVFDTINGGKINNKLKISPYWHSLHKEVSIGARVAIAGGKSVGKTTLLKYLINQTLSKEEKVLVFDFDIGQSEFGLPGCVTAVMVNEPLLGPNYTHSKTVIRSLFVGGIDCVKFSRHYFLAVTRLVNYVLSESKFQGITWFANLMGFTKGVGLTMTAAVINAFQPTSLIQLNANDFSRNYHKTLTPEFLWSIENTRTKLPFDLNYSLILKPSPPEEAGIKPNFLPKKGRNPAVENRTALILAYLNQIAPKASTLLEIVPKSLNLSNISIKDLSGSKCIKPNELSSLMVGDLLAISTKEEIPVECVGYGLVRGVSEENKKLYLITPVNETQLSSVTFLFRGSVALSKKFLFSLTNDLFGRIPYMSIGTSTNLNKPIKRSLTKKKARPNMQRSI